MILINEQLKRYNKIKPYINLKSSKKNYKDALKKSYMSEIDEIFIRKFYGDDRKSSIFNHSTKSYIICQLIEPYLCLFPTKYNWQECDFNKFDNRQGSESTYTLYPPTHIVFKNIQFTRYGDNYTVETTLKTSNKLIEYVLDVSNLRKKTAGINTSPNLVWKFTKAVKYKYDRSVKSQFSIVCNIYMQEFNGFWTISVVVRNIHQNTNDVEIHPIQELWMDNGLLASHNRVCLELQPRHITLCPWLQGDYRNTMYIRKYYNPEYLQISSTNILTHKEPEFYPGEHLTTRRLTFGVMHDTTLYTKLLILYNSINKINILEHGCMYKGKPYSENPIEVKYKMSRIKCKVNHQLSFYLENERKLSLIHQSIFFLDNRNEYCNSWCAELAC
jgi:hypothetical protein